MEIIQKQVLIKGLYKRRLELEHGQAVGQGGASYMQGAGPAYALRQQLGEVAGSCVLGTHRR